MFNIASNSASGKATESSSGKSLVIIAGVLGLAYALTKGEDSGFALPEIGQNMTVIGFFAVAAAVVWFGIIQGKESAGAKLLAAAVVGGTLFVGLGGMDWYSFQDGYQGSPFETFDGQRNEHGPSIIEWFQGQGG